MAFDLNNLGDDEKYILARIAAGEWATFSERAEKPRISAAFIRHLMLGLPGPDGKPWPIAPTGVRIRSILVEGRLDLCDAAGRDGAALPALLLEGCDFPDPIHLDHAHLARLSLKGSRFRELRGIDCQLDGALDISSVGPYSVDGAPDQCWVEMSGSRIDGDVEAEEGYFIAPPKREPRPPGVPAEYAFNFRGASIEGRVRARYITADGGIKLVGSGLGGEVWLRGATLIAKEGEALDCQSAQIDGALLVDACCERLKPFAATGRVWLLGATINGPFTATGGQFLNWTKDGLSVAIVADNTEIGGSVLLNDGFNARGQVNFYGARIAGSLECGTGQFINPSEDGTGQALVAANAEIGGDVNLNDGFKSEGQVSIQGAKIAGTLDANAGQFRNHTQASAGSTGLQGWILVANNIEIGGDAQFSDKVRLDGTVDLARAKILGQLKLQCSNDVSTTWLVRDAWTSKLSDWGGSGWGSINSTIELDGFRYDALDIGYVSKSKRSFVRVVQSILRLFLWGLFNKCPERAQWRIDWLSLYFERNDYFFAQPYVQLARVFRHLGYDDEARYILHHKRWREWHYSEGLLIKPFSWLFGVLFAFGYSTGHAIMTVLIFICIGTIGVTFANGHGMMAVDSLPVASVASKDSPGVLQALPESARTALPCGEAINPWLYAIDVFVPLIDLRQESKCEPASKWLGSETKPWGWFAEPDFWRWAKALYALLGWIVTSLAILTFSGVLQRRGEDL